MKFIFKTSESHSKELSEEWAESLKTDAEAMTDRDFKLLVREYFQAKAIATFCNEPTRQNTIQRMKELEKRILSELERFTEQEQQELPFKD